MATSKDLLDLLLTQDGDPYVMGAEASPSDSNPKAFDCAELVEWGCARLGVKPTMPDGSWIQARHCKKYDLMIPPDKAIKTPGALLFFFSESPFSGGRPDTAHVAVSQGNGMTFEARGKKYGVGAFSALNRGWTHAGLIPGLEYGEPVTAPPPPPTPEQMEKESKGKIYQVHVNTFLNIRSGPGTNYDVISDEETSLKNGDKVIVPDTEGWLPIVMEADEESGESESIGWVCQKFLKEAPKAPPPKQTQEAKPTAGPISGGLAPDLLQEIVPSLSDKNVESYTSALNIAMGEAKINTPLRQAAFIAQVAHESQGFSRLSENLNYRAERLLDVFGKYFDPDEAKKFAHNQEMIANRVYANRLGNGDEDSGEGWRYRGRGFIQVTGKSNYRDAGKFLKLDLLGNPELAEGPEVGARIAAWYWTSHDLNSYADRRQFDTITKLINGGFNGLEDRRAYYAKAKEVLGV